MHSVPDPVLLSLGSINADFQMRLERPVESSETLAAHDFTGLSGGKAANRAYLARRLGHPARLLGRVGDDDLREQALGALRDAGVDLAGVSVAAGQPTAFSVIAVPPTGKKAILLAGNANDAWDDDAAQAAADRIAAAPDGSVLAVDYEVPASVVRREAAARAKGLCLVLDPSWPELAECDVMAGAFAIAPNAGEAEALVGVKVSDPASAAEAARRLAALGPRLAFVKLEVGGCVLAEQGGAIIHIPPTDVPVVDTTGAGDAFTGALAVAVLEGMAPRDAVLFAVAASHLAVTAWGSQPAYPDRVRIEALVPDLARGMRDLPA